MFAARPQEAAREMVRVTRRGGRIVMGNWIPNDPGSFVSQLLRISSEYTPPPPAGFVSPMTWGVEAHLVERFGQAGIPREKIALARDTFTFYVPAGPEHAIEVFRQCYGPTMNAYAAAEKAGRAGELHEQLLALARAQARVTARGTAIDASYLRVTVRC